MDDRLGIGVLALLPCVFVVICLATESLRRNTFGHVRLNIENKKGLHIRLARGNGYCRK